MTGPGNGSRGRGSRRGGPRGRGGPRRRDNDSSGRDAPRRRDDASYSRGGPRRREDDSNPRGGPRRREDDSFGRDAPRRRDNDTNSRGGPRRRDDDSRSRGGQRERGDRPQGRGRTEGPAEGVALGFHAVRTALEHTPRRVERLLLARDQRDGRSRKLASLARAAGVPYGQVPREALDRLAGGLNHQGVAARLAETELLVAEELIERLPDNPLLLAVDEVSDPRNLGAMLRTAAAVGADGLFLPGHRNAGIGPAVRRTAQGGVDLVPIARSGNLSRLLERLAEEGIAAVALDPEGGTPYWQAPLTGGVVLVAGSEEKGIRPSVLSRCPVRAAIPVREEIGSLNVSVAMGILLAEAARQRSSAARGDGPAG